mmetsp:Transcript_21560/g.25309  ORF Transcript_21560/g.25309 Transcript_21560/m.25309 type:complete len:130 (-) Transcript_21560:982-1371(-)
MFRERPGEIRAKINELKRFADKMHGVEQQEGVKIIKKEFESEEASELFDTMTADKLIELWKRGRLEGWLDKRKSDLSWDSYIARYRLDNDSHMIEKQVSNLRETINHFDSREVEHIITRNKFLSCHLFT